MIDQHFRDELRARTPMATLVGRRVKLSRAGRNWKGCCPFHLEKTPSFYVYEDSFHCFGCGAHGDAIEFVMRTENADFMEAVEKLATDAGLDVPRATAQDAERQRARADIHDVLTHGAAYFRQALFSAEGADGLAYLRRRGLSDETIAQFNLGWSGAGRGALIRYLAQRDITPDMALQAGLLRQDDRGAPAGELFFNRVIFPIADRAGRTLSFGGRVLGDGQPKYLNGPETAVFSKRRTLYGLDRARAGVARGDALLVVEGYMDVIALHQAGFCGAVAPLGTALTEEQLDQLWRLSPVPLLCFDGDAAGTRAALRAATLALPQLTPEKSLKIIFLPGGDDPDSLIKAQGAEAFQATLGRAAPFTDAVYDLLLQASGSRTADERARFRTRLEEAADLIRDKSLASEYRHEWRNRYFSSRRRPAAKPALIPVSRDVSPVKVARERARILCAVTLRHPALIHTLEEAWARVDLSTDDDLGRLREAILTYSAQDEAGRVVDSASLIAHLHAIGLADTINIALGERPHPLPGFAAESVMPAEAAAGWWHIWGLMHPGQLDQEVESAYQNYLADGGEGARLRWKMLLSERERARLTRLHDGIGDDGTGEYMSPHVEDWGQAASDGSA